MQYLSVCSEEKIACWLARIHFDAQGLVAAIAQQYDSGEILMLAWMNAASIQMSLQEGRAVYWSRSRQQLWKKGESSGHIQNLVDFRLDCDCDAVLLLVDQEGVACHEGARSCFFRLFPQSA